MMSHVKAITAESDGKDPVETFIAECEAFCKEAPMKETTFSYKSMRGTYALQKIRNKYARITEQMVEARAFMQTYKGRGHKTPK